MTVLSIAHRGVPVMHRENTIESVTAAIDAGAEMVEIDVPVTRAGARMILHDAAFTRRSTIGYFDNSRRACFNTSSKPPSGAAWIAASTAFSARGR